MQATTPGLGAACARLLNHHIHCHYARVRMYRNPESHLDISTSTTRRSLECALTSTLDQSINSLQVRVQRSEASHSYSIRIDSIALSALPSPFLYCFLQRHEYEHTNACMHTIRFWRLYCYCFLSFGICRCCLARSRDTPTLRLVFSSSFLSFGSWLGCVGGWWLDLMVGRLSWVGERIDGGYRGSR